MIAQVDTRNPLIYFGTNINFDVTYNFTSYIIIHSLTVLVYVMLDEYFHEENNSMLSRLIFLN